MWMIQRSIQIIKQSCWVQIMPLKNFFFVHSSLHSPHIGVHIKWNEKALKSFKHKFSYSLVHSFLYDTDADDDDDDDTVLCDV